MNKIRLLYQWTIGLPLIACIFYFSGLADTNPTFQIIAGFLLISSVLSAVHHSEIVAHRVGEPFGTIILAISITIIEVAIIISLMMTGEEKGMSIARDTVYAAVMIILNGIVGMCLFIGGQKYREQTFSSNSVRIALVSLISIIAFTLILPTYTKSNPGPIYTKPQLIFESLACLVIYAAFILAQTVRHREYFLTTETTSQEKNHSISNTNFAISLVFLIISLIIVVLLAKTLSPTIEQTVDNLGLPESLVGIVIAAIILLPEGIAAVGAAKKNHLQTSLNLALGSALASIGLTIPAVSIISYIYDFPIILGLDTISIILLGISIFTVMLSLSGEKSNIIYGVVLLVNFFAYVFLTIIP